MLEQRPADAAPAVRGVAEALPFADRHVRRRTRGPDDPPLDRSVRRARGDAPGRPSPGRVPLRPRRRSPLLAGRLLPGGVVVRRRARRRRSTRSSPRWAGPGAPCGSRCCPYRTTAPTGSWPRTGGAPRPTSTPASAPASRRSRSSATRCSRRGSHRLRADLESGAWQRRYGGRARARRVRRRLPARRRRPALTFRVSWHTSAGHADRTPKSSSLDRNVPHADHLTPRRVGGIKTR